MAMLGFEPRYPTGPEPTASCPTSLATIHEALPPTQPSRPVPVLVRGARRVIRVLLVSVAADDPARALLAEAGAAVEVVGDLGEAEARFATGDFDVVLRGGQATGQPAIDVLRALGERLGWRSPVSRPMSGGGADRAAALGAVLGRLRACASVVRARTGAADEETRALLAEVDSLAAEAQAIAQGLGAHVGPFHELQALAPRPTGPLPRVLVVDDEPQLLKIYRRVLGRGYDLSVALGGTAAIELLEASGPEFSAIVSDLIMPDIDGVDLYHRVATLRPGLEHRIVFVTGGAFNDRSRDFLASIENRRLEKPFGPDVLERMVAEVIEQSTTAAALALQ